MMKRFTLITLSAFLMMHFANAQQREVNIQSQKFEGNPIEFKSIHDAVVDTLYPSSVNLACASRVDSLDILSLNASEWIFGCNSYGDLEGAQIYDLGNTSLSINKVLCFAQKMGVTGSIYAKLYEVDPETNEPTILIGTSLPRTNSSIPPYPMGAQMVEIEFEEAVPVSGKFAVSIEWFYDLPNGSAMGLASSRVGCTTSSDKNSWIKDADGVWFSSQTYTNNGAPMLSDLFVLPIGEVSVGIETEVDAPNISIYPNPVKDVLNININEKQDFSYGFKLINAQGVLLLNSVVSKNINAIDISKFPSGVYYYTISRDDIIYRSKSLIIVH